ncbi:CLUMA_CG010896, isoform A [Clunio marinus]|uniref:CLUMA_CG010896, isoform A n=1 Tax=Clunio marinus TaxID=568069 RepID=A0A1J1IBB8_9DIPT|nr:CLUMA_CG010896, isoform A [Clunio marinus]
MKQVSQLTSSWLKKIRLPLILARIKTILMLYVVCYMYTSILCLFFAHDEVDSNTSLTMPAANLFPSTPSS